MLRVLGNSSERVPLPDIRDVVYYRQIKEYTEQEYEKSRDLRREVAAGRLTILDRTDPLRGDSSSQGNNGGGVKTSDLRAALREILPELQAKGVDARGIALEMAPIVADLVRQELARLPLNYAQSGTGTQQAPTFVGPEYVPTVTTEGMVSNVAAKETEVSGNEADEALRMLRKMNGITP